ncbi:MAG: septum site-determining protein MinC [Prochlorococcus marinus CUG1434]|nr:septum site-determining protein MinC [Prochlorococcus marinus CUG1434]
MKIVLNNTKRNYFEIFSLEDLDNIHETFRKFFSIKGTIEAKILSINESISIHQLSKLKSHLHNLNVFSLCIYSNDRNTILAGKSLRINSTFLKEQEIKNKLLLFNSIEKEDILHEGTVRSGDRISSNGNLCIIGDVNPGAIVSAKNNIYVWGKLLGIAFAGKTGNNNASITSLYLKPLQLRIADVIAIGPKDKPHNYYPEIALIDKRTIIIKPHIIEIKN